MEDFAFKLEGVVRDKDEYQDFEGPLNLILTLLSKNKIEIRDISISDILDQYLEQIRLMQERDLDLDSEFVQMASHLVYIKSRMLITGEEEPSELEMLISSLGKDQLRIVTGPVSMPLTGLSERDCAYADHSTVIGFFRLTSPQMIGGFTQRVP